jgi:hypothetical protein
MTRSTGLMTVAVFSSLAMVLFANSRSAEAAGNCQDKLVGNSYDCNVADNQTPKFTECFSFQTGVISQYFDLDINSVLTLGCACYAKGSSKSPSFNSSSTNFACSELGGPEFLYIGTVKGKKLSIQGVAEDGEQDIGTCTLRSSPCP